MQDLTNRPVSELLTSLRKLAASRERMTIPQSRTGRRPMSVATMLDKDKAGTLWKDKLPGGLADKKTPTDFPPEKLREGSAVEREHTSDPVLQTEIAMDHMTEDPNYYPKLKRMEAGEKKAGILDVLKAPIPGTKDWFINTGKSGLQGAKAITGKVPTLSATRAANSVAPRVSGTIRSAGQTAARSGNSISEAEMRRLGFGDLLKSGAVHPALAKLAFKLQGHTAVQGVSIAIENRKGSVRKGTDPDGTPWRTVYKIPYGYIEGTEGNDGEEIDAYVGPDKEAPNVYVVHQRKLDGKGYDEDKVFFGFHSEEEVRKAYLKHYNKVGPKLLGPISTIAIADLKKRLEQRRKHTKLAYVSGGSGSGITGNRMAMLDMDERPDSAKAGDVPSRDGTNPGTAGIVRREAGPEMATILPTNGALASSGTGATTRL